MKLGRTSKKPFARIKKENRPTEKIFETFGEKNIRSKI